MNPAGTFVCYGAPKVRDLNRMSCIKANERLWRAAKLASLGGGLLMSPSRCRSLGLQIKGTEWWGAEGRWGARWSLIIRLVLHPPFPTPEHFTRALIALWIINLNRETTTGSSCLMRLEVFGKSFNRVLGRVHVLLSAERLFLSLNTQITHSLLFFFFFFSLTATLLSGTHLNQVQRKFTLTSV